MIKYGINEKDIEKIAKVMQEGEVSNVAVNSNLFKTSVYFRAENCESMLSLRVDENSYSITNVCLANQRNGIFTRMLKVIKEAAKRDNKNVILENVISEEMHNYCCKYKLERIDDEISRMLPDSFVGNYVVS